MFYKISGSQFHSGITLASIILGKVEKIQGLYLILAQIIGVGTGDALLYMTGIKNEGPDLNNPLPL